MRDVANLSLGVAVDILRGNVGSRDGGVVIRALGEVRKDVETGQKIGENKQVLDAPGASHGADACLKQAEELEDQARRLREGRGG